MPLLRCVESGSEAAFRSHSDTPDRRIKVSTRYSKAPPIRRGWEQRALNGGGRLVRRGSARQAAFHGVRRTTPSRAGKLSRTHDRFDQRFHQRMAVNILKNHEKQWLRAALRRLPPSPPEQPSLTFAVLPKTPKNPASRLISASRASVSFRLGSSRFGSMDKGRLNASASNTSDRCRGPDGGSRPLRRRGMVYICWSAKMGLRSGCSGTSFRRMTRNRQGMGRRGSGDPGSGCGRSGWGARGQNAVSLADARTAAAPASLNKVDPWRNARSRPTPRRPQRRQRRPVQSRSGRLSAITSTPMKPAGATRNTRRNGVA